VIVGERKPLEEIFQNLKPFKKVCVLGCGTCVTVCLSGGEKEAQETAAALTLHRKKTGEDVEVSTKTILRQCEYEYIDEIMAELKESDVILSLACGVGVQTLVDKLPEKIVLPGLNTTFFGYPVEQGVWLENCLGCGNCVLDKTQGICPITRCTKSMLNGPCGGSADGKCEIDKELDCGWNLIYDRLQKLGQLDAMTAIQPPKDWSSSHHGGPRKMVREDVRLNDSQQS
jgi:ferredoxin